ncbi:hypothetical protein [Enterobacter cancerogenus]
MTRMKFLEICRGKKNNKGFKAYYTRFYGNRNQVMYRVCLDQFNGFPSDHAIMYTTSNLAKAVDAENRFNMWLFQEGLHHDCRPADEGGAA